MSAVTVRITMKYDPDEPDEEHDAGMSEEEYDDLLNRLAELGGYDVDLVRER